MDPGLWPLVLVIGGALVVGLISGVTPFLPVEAYVLSVAVTQPMPMAVGAALGAGVGQSLAKVLIFSSVRSAAGAGWTSRLLARRRRSVLADPAVQPTTDPADGPRAEPPGAPPSADPPASSPAEPPADPPADPPVNPVGDGASARPRALAALRATLARWNTAGLALLSGRAGTVVVLLSGSVGLPPLLAVSAYAGASAMPRRTFAVACLLGRSARFLTLALVPGWAAVLGSHG